MHPIMSEETFLTDYRKNTIRRVCLIIVCLIGLILVIGYTCTITREVSIADSLGYIFRHIAGVQYEYRSEDWWNDYFIWNSLMPRIVVSVVAGASLAVAGCMMQSIVSNPLADPYTTGISSGACFGAVAALVAGMTFSTVAGEYGIVTNAFIGALIPALAVILITRFIRTSAATMILIGTAFSYFFNGITTLMMITADDETLQDAFLWQIGSTNGSTWDDIPIMLVVCVIGTLFVLLSSKKLNIMMIGEDEAHTLGLNVTQFRIVCLAILSIMTASIIAYTGIIGFVGLLVPHLVRLIMGSDNRYVVVGSMVMGALVLATADLLSRVLSHSGEIPVGVIMSFIGGPLFLMMVLMAKKGYGDAY